MSKPRPKPGQFHTRRGITAGWTLADLQIATRKRSRILNSMIIDERHDDSMAQLSTVESQFLLPMRRIASRDEISI